MCINFGQFNSASATSSLLKYKPAVFAVGDRYEIFIRFECEVICSLTVGNGEYFDETNGVLRSAGLIRRISVPMSVLDAARSYTVKYRAVPERLAYHTECKPEISESFSFSPVPENGDISVVHLADVHGDMNTAVKASSDMRCDVLILNGDIVDCSENTDNFEAVYSLCERLTHAGKPIIFSRGNHDMRGACAEKLFDYFPADNGNSFFTFRLGRIWGILLDCGEDKLDDNVEYGGTIRCHEFRLRQTDFISRVIKNSENEYRSPGVEFRMIVSHVPFSLAMPKPFDIEHDTYREWSALLKEYIKPDIMLCGHMHFAADALPGGKYDNLGQPCRMIIGSACEKRRGFTAANVILSGSGISCSFNSAKAD